MTEGCLCQNCGNVYKVDLLVADELWEKIKPKGKMAGEGMLCGSCIMKKIEGLGKFSAFEMEEII